MESDREKIKTLEKEIKSLKDKFGLVSYVVGFLAVFIFGSWIFTISGSNPLIIRNIQIALLSVGIVMLTIYTFVKIVNDIERKHAQRRYSE